MHQDTIAQLHDQLSEWSLTLLSPHSETLIIAREWNSLDEDFRLTIRVRFSQWVQDKHGQQLFANDCVVDGWTMTGKEDIEKLIELLQTAKANMWPENNK